MLPRVTVRSQLPAQYALSRVNEMYARIAAGHSGAFKYNFAIPVPTERLNRSANLCDHAPFVCSARSQRLWVEAGTPRSSPLRRDNSTQ